jgi:hypothetical protein
MARATRCWLEKRGICANMPLVLIRMKHIFAAACWVFFSATSLTRAVILATGDGTQNATDTGAGDGWNYVGTVSGASGVYLGTYGGQHWVITGWHVVENDFILNGTTYNRVPDSSIRVKNADNTDTDLRLFRITQDPGWANLPMITSQLPVNSSLTLIGYGRNRETGLTHWTSSWIEVPSGGTYSGYKWATGNTKRWGTNTLEGFQTFNAGNGNVSGFYTDFDNTTNEAQGSTGDSGGGVFYFDGTKWQLAGLMLAIGGFDGQPSETSVFGNVTFMADLSQYQAWIMAAIPEPSTYALLLLGVAVLGWTRWQRRG